MKLVIFDYSGTLSFDAARFRATARLTQALRESGLWQLGLDNLVVFWQEVLNPTWEKGSTTATGYRQLLVAQIDQLLNPQQDLALSDQIKGGVAKFVDSYFAASHISPAWQPLLTHLLTLPEVVVVVATDHYQEVTQHIVDQLKALNLASRSILEGPATPAAQQIFIANSADIGVRKLDIAFWQKLKTALVIKALSQVVLVDDFVANEYQGDQRVGHKVAARRIEQIVSLIATVFQAPVDIFPMFEESEAGEDLDNEQLVREASAFIQEKLR